MKTNSKIILGLLGISMSANAETAQIGIPLIKREDLQKISETYNFPDMEKSLLESGIIKELKLREYYLVLPTRLNEETNFAYEENDSYIIEVLKAVKKERVLLNYKKFNEMSSTTQDYSPFIKIDGAKLNDRFIKRAP
jgi:hypothetical protein